MRTLIIFDNQGIIYYQASGSFITPSGGVQYLIVDVPENKFIAGIDMTGETPEAILSDQPKDKITMLEEQVDALNIAIAEMMGV